MNRLLLRHLSVSQSSRRRSSIAMTVVATERFLLCEHQMRMQFYRLTLCVIVAAAAWYAAHRSSRQIPGPDWSVPDGERDTELDRSRALDVQMSAIGERLKEKLRLVEEVRAGRMSVGDARARFRELIVSDPTSLAQFRARSPGLSDDELAAQNLARHMAVSQGD